MLSLASLTGSRPSVGVSGGNTRSQISAARWAWLEPAIARRSGCAAGRPCRARAGSSWPASPARGTSPCGTGGNDFDVRVAVVAVVHLTALAEQRVRLVEQQHRPALLGGVEHAAQVLLGLADVFADHAASPPIQTRRTRSAITSRPASCRCHSRRRRARSRRDPDRCSGRRSPRCHRRAYGGGAGR